MKINDLVLIPGYKSRNYYLAKITSDYQYLKDSKYHHSRNIEILVENIPRDIFDQNVIYSLGAYRTLFKVKTGDQVVKSINMWMKTQEK